MPPRDVKALYREMMSFVRDRERVRAMAATARPLVSERYEQQYVRQCLADFYKEILK